MNENDWIEKIKSGDKQSFEELYIAYRKEFIVWVTSVYRLNLNDAQDIYQQSVVLLYENIVNNKLSELTSKIKTYLFAIGKNLMHENNRKNARYLGLSEISEDDPIEEELEVDENYGFRLSAVRDALQKLGDPCKRLLELHYFYNKSMEEISLELNYKNKDTTKNLKYKCMIRLRKIYHSEVKAKPKLTYG